MDFFKNCQTGIYALNDFSNVGYKCLSIGSSNIDDGRKLEFYHRMRNTLANWQSKTGILWIFEAPEGANRLANTTVELLDGLETGQTAMGMLVESS